jgi:hypothetical protein
MKQARLLTILLAAASIVLTPNAQAVKNKKPDPRYVGHTFKVKYSGLHSAVCGTFDAKRVFFIA